MTAAARRSAVAEMESPFTRFAATRPRLCYCADTFPGPVLRWPRDLALEMLHVQVGGIIRVQAYLAFDVDRDGARSAWKEAGVPAPTLAMTNPVNGHAHLLYELSIPVALYPISAQTRFFAAVENALTKRLGADVRYVGLVAKNPLHPFWTTQAQNARHDLPTIAASLSKAEMAAWPERSRGVGRNCDLFDWARWQAYASVREFSDERAFAAAVAMYALAKNRASFDAPLTDKEVGWIVKSVARWTWERRERYAHGRKVVRRGAMGFDKLPAALEAANRLEAVADRRAAAGRVSAEARAASTRARIQSAVDSLVAEGKRVTGAAVVRYTGLGVRTVKRHRDLLPTARKRCHTVYSGVEVPRGAPAPALAAGSK